MTSEEVSKMIAEAISESVKRSHEKPKPFFVTMRVPAMSREIIRLTIATEEDEVRSGRFSPPPVVQLKCTMLPTDERTERLTRGSR
jgi:hypothetical protein